MEKLTVVHTVKAQKSIFSGDHKCIFKGLGKDTTLPTVELFPGL